MARARPSKKEMKRQTKPFRLKSRKKSIKSFKERKTGRA